MFIGREAELTQLERLYAMDQFQFALLYGRRQIGKTTLIAQFCQQKKSCLYFTAMESNERQNLALFSSVLRGQFPELGAEPASFEEALRLLFEYSKEHHMILVLDDYHFLTKACKGFPSMLATMIEQYREHSHMLLILASCSMPILEKEFFSAKAPYREALTCPMHIQPLGFFVCRKFFRNISSIDLAYIYGMVGGIPDYLLLMNERLSLEDNVRNTFFNPSSLLFEEPFLLLKQEVREPALYNAILCAIAGGATKLSEIAVVIGEETSVCAAYLKNLIMLEVVCKETPSTETSSKKTIYRICDPVFRFWYSFVPEVLTEIHTGRSDLAYRRIEPKMTEFMGEVFEEICKQYLIGLSDSGKTPFPLTDLGRWWGTDPFTKEKLNVPILASDGAGSMLFGTCKWSNDKMDTPELSALIAQSENFSCQSRCFYLFSKNGFTRACQDSAEQLQGVTLVSFSK